ncbi:MAG: VWA domain-containing protein [Ferruginibacter sp.]
MALQFQHTEYLLALAAVPLMLALYFFVLRWKKKTIKKIGDPALVNQLIIDYSPSKFAFKFILFLFAFTAGVIALANPRMPLGSTPVNRNGIDVMIALDVSKSMLARDVKPSRLDRAKQIISKLIDRLQDDRIGIVVFAGRAYLQMPLTTDHAAAKMYLSSATPDVVPTQGTVIGDALKMCYAAFNTNDKKYRSVILISDGEDHDENAIKLSKALANEGLMINTIGIGSPEGSLIMDPETNQVKQDATGNPVITKLNEIELKSIATNGGGIYQLFTSTDEIVSQLEKQLTGMGQRTITENSLVNYKSFFPWLLGVVLILLVIEFFISEIKTLKKYSFPGLKKPANASTIICALAFIPCAGFAQNDNSFLRKGNEAYKNNQYEVAGENYKKAAEKNPANQKAQFNLGNAFYKSKKPEDAVLAYDAAIQNSMLPAEKSGAFYNKGVVLQNQKKLPECIAAYKSSLRLNPADEDARLNLQKALLQQKQQQQKDQKDNKDQKKPKDDQQKKDQQKPEDKKDDLPKPQQSKMTKKEAEEKLKALLQQEKALQDKLRKVNAASPEKPEKDW